MRSIQTNPMIFMSDRLSVAFSFSRRAHLLTTPKGRWYCLRQPCALRGGCSSCGSLWTMPHSFKSVVIVHAVGLKFCFIIKTVVSIMETTHCLRKPATGSFVAERVSLFTTPFSFLQKETKTRIRCFNVSHKAKRGPVAGCPLKGR